MIFANNTNKIAINNNQNNQGDDNDQGDNSSSKSIENNINSLLEKRSNIICKDIINISDLNDVDLKLAKLGIEFLTEDQVKTQFPETKTDKKLALAGQTIQIASRVSTPSSNRNTWMSYRTSSYLYGGKKYNIQRLIAQPKQSSSALCNSGSRMVTFSTNWSAGIANVIKSSILSAVGLIQGSTFALAFYDAVSSFLSGISRTTEVKVPHINYSWSSTTTAVFTYIRLESQTDNYQWLSLISTKTQTVVGYTIPTFNYKSSNGYWYLTPKLVQGNRTIYGTPNGYDSYVEAIFAYNSIGGGPRHRAISSITISGPESKTVQVIYPCYPQFPLHCE